MAHPALISAEQVVRRYGATMALRGVDFTVRGGAVNVLIGENGAGKSTLMRILAGIERPDGGRLTANGQEVRFASVRDAAAAGIGIVHQELNLCPNLSVADNIFLDAAGRDPLIDRAGERRHAAAVLARLGAAGIDPDRPVGTLRIGQQQIVEIARALARETRILILDEPTSALSAAEVEVLFGIIGELRRDGVGIVYISHRLEELMRIGDYVTVMRDGQVMASVPVADASVDWIVATMLGAERTPGRRAPGAATAGDVVLAFEDVRIARDGGGALIDHFDCGFRAGEITAVYGLLGAGRTELFEYAMGLRGGSGTVRLAGAAIDHLPAADRIERRLLLVPEDRQREGLFANLGVGGNLSLSVLDRLRRWGLLAARPEADAIAGMIARLGIKARSGATPIGALSGGNQQKVVIGRCLLPGPLAMLLDEPSRGVDIGARTEIFAAMRRLAADGIAIVFATSDLAEALEVADRIVVIGGGRVTADLPAAAAREADLVRAANAAAVC
ncbi:MAG: sugar ABC transporter ATP-binding protein [Sphingomonas fennica]